MCVDVRFDKWNIPVRLDCKKATLKNMRYPTLGQKEPGKEAGNYKIRVSVAVYLRVATTNGERRLAQESQS